MTRIIGTGSHPSHKPKSDLSVALTWPHPATVHTLTAMQRTCCGVAPSEPAEGLRAAAARLGGVLAASAATVCASRDRSSRTYPVIIK